ncbi:MAG: hypothetical protein BAJALOKI2v1_780004 [Promethearchaeota archaeon]|nr:MAG: hypothetical protein BAJALOKI2v1_780004 [Candidatus Lokiarchaeota archaeon]
MNNFPALFPRKEEELIKPIKDETLKKGIFFLEDFLV